jgi:hypothetical protein
MTELITDIKLAWRQVWTSLGTAMTVVPVLVLGVALNIVVLSAVQGLRTERHPRCRRQVTSVARSEIRAIRTVVTLALKKIGDSRGRWCSAEQQMRGRQAEATQCGAGIAC